jgi:hypothetical protein
MSDAVIDDLRKRAATLRANVAARRSDRALTQAVLNNQEAEDLQSLKMADDLDAAANTLSQ